jgi:hypothetical protein
VTLPGVQVGDVAGRPDLEPSPVQQPQPAAQRLAAVQAQHLQVLLISSGRGGTPSTAPLRRLWSIPEGRLRGRAWARLLVRPPGLSAAPLPVLACWQQARALALPTLALLVAADLCPRRARGSSLQDPGPVPA